MTKSANQTVLPGPLKFMRTTGIVEGISYLILLFIAMPLKYFMDIPAAVSTVGMAHGVLFVAFIFSIIYAMYEAGLTFKKALIAFLASLIPFGTFFLDKPVFGK